MPSRLSRFTDRLVTLSKRAISGDPAPAVKKDDGGYADWVIVVIHGLCEYLDLLYRRSLDILHERQGIVENSDDSRNSTRPMIRHKRNLRPALNPGISAMTASFWDSEWRDPDDFLEPLTGGPFFKFPVGQYHSLTSSITTNQFLRYTGLNIEAEPTPPINDTSTSHIVCFIYS